MIIECNVWCVSNTKDEIDLGLPEGDQWMPFVVNFRSIVAIKLAGESEFLGDDKAVIYFDSQYLTIDITFKNAVKLWRDTLKE